MFLLAEIRQKTHFKTKYIYLFQYIKLYTLLLHNKKLK